MPGCYNEPSKPPHDKAMDEFNLDTLKAQRRETLAKLKQGYLHSFPHLSVQLAPYVGRGGLKPMPDMHIESIDPEHNGFKLAIEVIIEPISIEHLRSRLTRLRQQGYAGVTWYLHPVALQGNNERWLWQQKQEGYVLQLDPKGRVVSWRDITCPRKVWR